MAALSIRPCRECGKPFQPRQTWALFCDTACRGAFNRRRRDRGTEVYDFVMALSHGADVRDVLDKLCDAYKQADKVLRNGRESFQPTTLALTRIPQVFGEQGDKR